MPTIGANGSVTTYPSHGEKICAGCEHWRGARTVTNYGACATTRDGRAARCTRQGRDTFPNQVCSCCPQCFEKWREVK